MEQVESLRGGDGPRLISLLPVIRFVAPSRFIIKKREKRPMPNV